MRDIAVVGLACVFPGADDAESFWANVVNGVDAVTPVPAARWPGHALALHGWNEDGSRPARGGFVRTPYVFDAARHRVMPAIARDGDSEQFILLDVVAEALRDAGIAESDPVRRETDLLVGRGGYMSNGLMEVFLRGDCIPRIDELLDDRVPALSDRDRARLHAEIRSTLPADDVDRLATCIPNLVASRAANRLDLGGAAWIVDAACASSLIAVEQAMQRLRDGRCDVAVAAGINFSNVPAFWYLFDRLGALSRTGTIRPFDRRADGILVAEGAGALVLMRAEDARARDLEAHALLKGAGSASDGAAAGVLAPDSGGQVRALRRAYDDAGVDPADVGLLEAHGTATAAGDGAELETIRGVFGESSTRWGTRAMGSVKSMIGHAMPAAGMASLVKTIRALSAKVLPPSLHCAEPHPALQGLPFHVNTRARPWTQPPRRGPRRAGVNAFGFGGINAHVVLEEAGHAGPRARPISLGVQRPSEVLAFSAADRATLAARMRVAARFVREDRGAAPGRPSLEDVAHAAARDADAAAPCRVAVLRAELAGTDAVLEDLARRIEAGQDVRDEAAGIAFQADEDPAAPPPKVATVFPGLGFPGMTGEFPDHVLATCLHFPAAREVMDLAEERDAHPGDSLPTSFLLVPPEHVPEDEARRLRGRFAPVSVTDAEPQGPIDPATRSLMHAGALLSNHMHWRVLEGLRFPVAMACGQSIGDISASWATGIASYEETVDNAWKILSVALPTRARGATAIIATTEERTQRLAEGLDVEIAIHLSPGTQLLGGPEADLAQLVRRAAANGVLAHVLTFPPIHTKYMAGVAEEVRALVEDDSPVRLPRIPFYSALLAERVPDDPEAIRHAIRDNFTHPVRFWQTVRRMYDDGARIFVQVGSGSLAANARGVLDAADATFLATDVAHRHPLTQIQLAAAALFSRGVPLDMTGLFQGRRPHAVALDAPRSEPARPAAAVDLVLYRPPLLSQGPLEPVVAPQAQPEVARGLGGLPFLDRVVSLEPGREAVVETRLDVREDRYLLDHLMINAWGVKPPVECVPVMPMAMTLEMLAECAALLAPGLGLVGIEAVRGRRWIAFGESGVRDARLEARVVAREADAVAVLAAVRLGDEVAAEATLRFAPCFEETLRFGFTEMLDPQAHPHAAAALYDEGHLFHGPLWRCIADIGPQDGESDALPRSIVAELVVPDRAGLFASLPAPQLLLDPVILDGVGQVLGALVMTQGKWVLPVAIEQVELYCPTPPAGTRIPVRVEIEPSEPGSRIVTARIEAQDGEGGAWFRIKGWQDVVLGGTPALHGYRREPSTRTACEMHVEPDGRTVTAFLSAETLRDVDLDWLARFVLHRSEVETFTQLPTGARRRDWLAGRLAAKDAIRTWMRVQGHAADLGHPAALVLGNDASGRPCVRSAGAGAHGLPCVSIAHSGGAAVAVASADPVGVDIEPRDAARSLVPGDVATDDELALMAGMPGATTGDERLTLLWCAKEAAAKAMGAGLDGRPRAWRVSRDGAGLVVTAPDGQARVAVSSRRAGDLVVATARAPALAARPGAQG